jgi:hypothetical protein
MSHYEHYENQIDNHDNFLKHKSYNWSSNGEQFTTS